ncbi:MAG: hypothetical protein IPM53_03345 [Anaerolineaceae bacterium]|nr:hypothetical protein [Anaerolineaceae bacterium]
MINHEQRRVLSRLVIRLFSPPYLPRKILSLLFLLIFTDAVLRLIEQPPEYWVNHKLALSSLAWLLPILAVHPLAFLGVMLLLNALAMLLLDGLNRTPALIAWTAVSFVYLNNTLQWINRVIILPLGIGDADQNVVPSLLAILLMGLWAWLAVPELLGRGTAVASTTRSKLFAVVGLGIWGALLTVGVLHAMTVPASGWQTVTPEHLPTPRTGGEIAYNSAQGKALLFGGSGTWVGGDWIYDSETWEWDGTDWTQQFPDVAPPGRGGLAMAYDANADQIIMFGGRVQDTYFNDTWTWNGTTWQIRYPVTNPPAREGHEMVFDEQRGQVVLYGGHSSSLGYLNDAWAWDGQSWSEIKMESTSPQAATFSLVYHQARQSALAIVTGSPGGTWFWRDGRWANLRLSGDLPYDIVGASATYDRQNERVVLFGGIRAEEILNETWVFEHSQWQKLDLPLSPSPRWGHAAFYDESREKIIIFGGFDGTDSVNEMWELALTEK